MAIRTILLAALAVLATASSLTAADMPSKDAIPVPQHRPDAEAQPVPVPEAKPQDAGPKASGDQADQETPKQDESTPEETVAPPKPEDPKAYASCLAELKELGVDFSEKPGIDDGKGCGIDKPLAVRSVLPGIALEPEATTRCETARQLSLWTRDAVLPAASRAFPSGKGAIKTVHQATSYACRNRNSAETGKLSEHARGNAIDVSGFTFADGSTFTIAPRERDSTLDGAFERAIIATGCLYFTTVLGPASDAAHQTHLHLDVIDRKAGYRYCW